MQDNTGGEAIALTQSLIQLLFPKPSPRDFTVQLAVHFEEFAELLETVELNNSQIQFELGAARAALNRISNIMRKDDSVRAHFSNRVAALDALGDNLVTSFQVAHQASFNLEGAFLNIGQSNQTKLVDGKPIYDDTGKWKKGPDYKPPELASFIL